MSAAHELPDIDECPACRRGYDIIALKFRLFKAPLALMVCMDCGMVQPDAKNDGQTLPRSRTGFRELLAALCYVLLTVMSGAARAQTTGAVDPSPAPAEPSVKEDVPQGGCMPIGLTASGEIVFPIQCKDLIERQRGKAAEQRPTAAEEKPAAKQSEAVAPENSKPRTIKRVETVPSARRVKREPRERAVSSNECTRNRTYDPESGTYKGYDGQRHSCRPPEPGRESGNARHRKQAPSQQVNPDITGSTNVAQPEDPEASGTPRQVDVEPKAVETPEKPTGLFGWFGR